MSVKSQCKLETAIASYYRAFKGDSLVIKKDLMIWWPNDETVLKMKGSLKKFLSNARKRGQNKLFL